MIDLHTIISLARKNNPAAKLRIVVSRFHNDICSSTTYSGYFVDATDDTIVISNGDTYTVIYLRDVFIVTITTILEELS